MEDIERLEKTAMPNVIVDTATHIRQFVQQMEMTPETIVKDLLFKVSLPNLTKLLDTASTNNLSHKTGALSKVVFENDMKNVAILTSRVQLCEKALKTAMNLAFTSNYMDESGTFLRKQFTADNMSAMSEINKNAGRVEGMAAVASAAAAIPPPATPAGTATAVDASM